MFGWFKPKITPLPREDPPPLQEDFSNPEKIFAAFTAFTGIHFKQKEAITATKLIRFCRNHALSSFDQFHSRLQSDGALVEELINYLTVNETYFFREIGQINFMARRAASAARPVRILCAPGSTGEEPFSIAITLLEKGVSPSLIQIVSLDINSDAIRRAKEGIYTSRAFHKTSPELQQRYFIHQEGRFIVRDELKRLVEFHTLNIFDDELFELGRFDYLFSRNMLIYFDTPTAQKAVERLGRMARSKESLFFFGHADIVGALANMEEHYEEGTKFYTLLSLTMDSR